MKAKTNDLRDAFRSKSSISSKELAAYFHGNDINVSNESIRQRISRLKRQGVLVSISQGVYALTEKPLYQQEPDTFIQKLTKNFSTAYPEIISCTWSSAWLYNFMVHQPAQYFYLFETEADIVEATFNLFKDHNLNAWLDPDEQTMQLYVMGSINAVIVKPVVSRAPLMKSGKSSLPAIEKMLVDAWAEKKLFFFIQGQELINIFNFAFGQYSISYSRLIGYARRRGIEHEIDQFVRKNVKPQNRSFLND
ncbi:MAG: DUF6577 family protein [Bacteroidales bacterium]